MYTEIRQLDAEPGIQVVVVATPSEACRADFGRQVIDQLRQAEAMPEGLQYDELTPRESEVLALIASGMENAEIARHLVISKRTVETHVSRIYAKLALRTRCQAVLYAIRHGVV